MKEHIKQVRMLDGDYKSYSLGSLSAQAKKNAKRQRTTSASKHLKATGIIILKQLF